MYLTYMIDHRPSFFRVQSKLDKLIQCSRQYWLFIINQKHPELLKHFRSLQESVEKSLIDPDIIRISQQDKTVYLYYKQFNDLFLCCVVKHLNSDGFLITIYPTKIIKEGDLIWTK